MTHLSEHSTSTDTEATPTPVLNETEEHVAEPERLIYRHLLGSSGRHTPAGTTE